ncbi:proto-oncogene tyrosine-protein kinase ROS isoform X2 [Dermacentor andersoni]|uniref:proto-oncogene tyrosine-protein kinase ROS isoform X2 n=1 Tax=Dermacentor andersoni TaxID=34620 RepID=UPI003B3AD1B2
MTRAPRRRDNWPGPAACCAPHLHLVTTVRWLCVWWPLQALLLLCAGTCGSPDVDVVATCYADCGSRLLVEEESFNVVCDEDCRLRKCRDGCDKWRYPSSCDHVCNKTTSSHGKDLFCLMGCNLAVTEYLRHIKAQIGQPPPPYLVADSRTHDTVTIRWKASQLAPNVTYLVQWKYEALPSDWEYYRPDLPLAKNVLRVQGLRPYTKYRFRVAWILLPNQSPLFSQPSIVISTEPRGVPSTPPKITSLTTVGPRSIAVSWDPPLFPNGPILSYALYLVEHPSGFTTVKDVSDVSGGLYFMFSGLRPEVLYTVSVATNNNLGMGPADKRNITTPPQSVSNMIPIPEPYLIIATKRQVLRQGLSIMDAAVAEFYTPSHSVEIVGVGMHVSQNVLFVADSSGTIYRVDLSEKFRYSPIMHNASSHPGLLSVDWLSQLLYIVEDGQITRCNFTGQDCRTAVWGFEQRPSEMKVDPYNGYLYWVLQNGTTGGLYRIDLARILKSAAARHDAQLLVKDTDLRTFVVDYKNYRLLLPKKSQNTVVSVSLSAGDETDVRRNSQRHQFTDVRRLDAHGGNLYWTTAAEAFGEEYHDKGDKFYHNKYTLEGHPLVYLGVFHPLSQPFPVPVNPVQGVQAIFKEDLAKIAWEKPRLLGGLGAGAWQQWLYEVRVQDQSTQVYIYAMNISETTTTVRNLRPDTAYSVKVRAYSPGGRGPWSVDFVGRTLRKPSKQGFPYMLWSANEALLKSDIVGDSVQPLIHWSSLNGAYITDIAWYQNQLFLNTNTSAVYTYNVSSHFSLERLPNITHAAAVAVDWLAPKLYWSSPLRQMISRSNLDGTHPEALPFLTMAQEIAVDSLAGYLYWATSHSVECSRLNGDDRLSFFQTGLFSGKQVMGLTLDVGNKKVYWMVRSFEGSKLFQAPMRKDVQDNHIAGKIIGPLSESEMKGPVWYFSDRLYWIHQEKQAVISNMLGQSVATLKGLGLFELKALAVVDSSLQPYPGGMDKAVVNVVPSQIMPEGIQVIGTWENFTIIWPLESDVNYGKVHYELRIKDDREVYTQVTEANRFVYPSSSLLRPYTRLEIVVRAYTFWASSRPTATVIYSPMSVPTEPLQPRVFVSHKSSPLRQRSVIEAEFRWARPQHPNGVIESHRVNCWFFKDGSISTLCRNVRVSGDALHYRITDLLPNTTYYFQVGAATRAGEGPMSEVVQMSTAREHPVPRLLLAKTDAVKLSDVDLHQERLLSSKASRPVALAYLGRDGRVFWLEEKGLLMASALDGSNISVVHSLPSAGTSLAIDWVGRYLYWTENKRSTGQSSIIVMDLNRGHNFYSVLNSSEHINSVEVDPFTSTLIYTVTNERGSTTLMMCNADGSNPRRFFQRRHTAKNELFQSSRIRKRRDRYSCTCDPHSSVGQAVTLDRSVKTEPRLLWVDGDYGHVWSADLEGCNCTMIVNATEVKDVGLPPTCLTADKFFIYWSNSSTGKIYSYDKSKSAVVSDSSPNGANTHGQQKRRVQSEAARGIRGIRAIGDHLQPYPDAECLSPPDNVTAPTLVSSSSHELVIKLPEPVRPPVCQKVSMASIKYTLFYGLITPDNVWQCSESLYGCRTLETYNTTVILKDLLPFTNYTVRVAMSNFYSIGMSSPGPNAIFLTAEGAPSEPILVQVEPLTPTRIAVQWRPPIKPNGHPLSYEVRWYRDGSVHKWHSMSYLTGAPTDDRSLSYRMLLKEMVPGTKYNILVRAYSRKGDMHSDSELRSVTTFDLPSNLTLARVTSREMDLTWTAPSEPVILSHRVEYLKPSTSEWRYFTSEATQANRTYIYPLRKLLPRTRYSLRMVLTYRSSLNDSFPWPPTGHFAFQTLADSPGKAAPPEVSLLGKDLFQVRWEDVPRNGGELLLYELQVRAVDLVAEQRSDDGSTPTVPSESAWVTAYNSSANHWIIRDLQVQHQYVFRVRALNEYGEGEYSEPSEPFTLPEPGAVIGLEYNPVRKIIVFAFLGVLLFASVLVLSLYIVYKRRQKEKKVLQDNVRDLRPDLELATLSELPRNGNFIQQNNALYALGDLPVDEELASVPLIERDQIILTKFLGSGAFGEVYEGIAHNLGGEGMPPAKVAVKNLRKGATEQEKAEFLKEAKLMSNFKHEHILRLLGISLDNSLHFIILELMEGGDLLSYLRSNRPVAGERSPLTLNDLLSICVDVAKGCKYLEDMHFVHRDLAARNCLVSSTDPAERVVKIGDFGLARDIYKHDYYRKEGEGLLPVRWMPPESLVDGVFTNHSDVWAFGVLLWEVMTMGQQPYPARNNLEVLHYVREGGRLDNPDNCPDDLHDLMLRCWSYNPEGRPDFAFCLETLEFLREKYQALVSIATAVHNSNYLGQSFMGGIDNMGYQGERYPPPVRSPQPGPSKVLSTPEQNSLLLTQESDCLSISSDPAATQLPLLQHSRYNATPLMPEIADNATRYLQLLCDSEPAVDADGYEVPLPLPPNHVQAFRQAGGDGSLSLETSSLRLTSKPRAPLPVAATRSSRPKATPPPALSLPSLSPPAVPRANNTNSAKEQSRSRESLLDADQRQCNGDGSSDCGRRSPTVTSALLKSPKSSCSESDSVEGAASAAYDPIETLKEIFTRGGGRGREAADAQGWSLSTSSTAPCTPCTTSGDDSAPASHRNSGSGISSLSATSAMELDYMPKSSWC